LSLELWVWFDQRGKMPIVAACGVWKQAGWFLQWIGDRWRWHVGGVDCDGGRPELGRWIHVVAMYDGQSCRLFQDGRQVAERKEVVNQAVWPGDMFLGQYNESSLPDFQVLGRITGVKIYHRPLTSAEIAQGASKKPIGPAAQGPGKRPDSHPVSVPKAPLSHLRYSAGRERGWG
jgi:hypothetical protein